MYGNNKIERYVETPADVACVLWYIWVLQLVTTQTDQAVKTDHCQPPTTIILIQIIIITSLTTYTYNLHYKLYLQYLNIK